MLKSRIGSVKTDKIVRMRFQLNIYPEKVHFTRLNFLIDIPDYFNHVKVYRATQVIPSGEAKKNIVGILNAATNEERKEQII